MKVYWFILILVSFGCSKYEHPDLKTPSCTLCAFADSLEGTYRGMAIGFSLIDNPAVNYNPSDSMTMVVQQIFLGDSPYIDSSRMHFVTEYWYDYTQIHKFDTIEIIRDDGYVEHDAYREFGVSSPHPSSYYWVTPDHISIGSTVFNPDLMANIVVYSAYLIKQ